MYNQASIHLNKILSKAKPDILCLQEIDTDESSLLQIEKYGYKLADYSNSFIRFGKIFGVATFYNPAICKLLNTSSYQLPRSIYETILLIIRFLKGGNEPRTVLKSKFQFKNTKKTLALHNTHLGVFESNQSRVKRMQKIISFNEDEKNSPTVITGDLNYHPYARRQLENLMKTSGFLEATRSLNYTSQLSLTGKLERYNLIQRIFSKIIQKLFSNRFKLDYMFYKNLKLVEIKRIDTDFSDHYPIIAKYEI